jgi:hypothetical protein
VEKNIPFEEEQERKKLMDMRRLAELRRKEFFLPPPISIKCTKKRMKFNHNLMSMHIFIFVEIKSFFSLFPSIVVEVFVFFSSSHHSNAAAENKQLKAKAKKSEPGECVSAGR